MKLPGDFDEEKYNRGYSQTFDDPKIDQGVYYQTSQTRIKYYKSQQWYIVFYCLLIFAAIVGMFELAECEIVYSLLRIFTIVAFIVGEGLILKTQRMLQRERLLIVKNRYWEPGLFYLADDKKQEAAARYASYSKDLGVLLVFLITIALAFAFAFLYLIDLV